ncbi:MAG: prolyl oligopeptidase family serine peptidase [Candidatus Hydrogenedentes bacterium]|jgi:dienelactone hydrolase|nr:prolyl oligopeptidase family serine peptidase [Candidatus Hydrogenedentota bacterium]
MRKALKILGGFLLVLIVVLLIAKFWADYTYFNNYDPTLPFNIKVEETAVVDDTATFFGITRPRRFEKIQFTMDARAGESIPVLLTLPVDRKEPVPVIIFLHGIGQSKGFIQEICTPFNEAGFAMACFDQSMQGSRKVHGILEGAYAFRQRPWKTINETRRLIDYLQTYPEIDPDRIYLVGASYGAITGSTVTAFDERIRASVLVVGGANIRTMLDAPMLKSAVSNRLLHWMGKQIVAFIMSPADPKRYAAGTAGRPVIMLNGSEDTLVSPAAGEALYAALGEPKDIKWYPCDHPGLREGDAQIVVDILDDGLEWLLEQDKPFRKDAPAVEEKSAEEQIAVESN